LYSLVGDLFMVALFFLVCSVVQVGLTAFNVFASAFSFLFCLFSFVLNAFSIAVTLKKYKFEM
jgi:hypothetical protein